MLGDWPVTRLGLRPYRDRGRSAAAQRPASRVVVLTRDEEVNIARCLASVGWAAQVVVIDSGSADQTVPLARSLGADVVEQPWLGFSAQREFALRLPEIRHDWVYFVDADEWVSRSWRPRSRPGWAQPTARPSPTGSGWSS